MTPTQLLRSARGGSRPAGAGPDRTGTWGRCCVRVLGRRRRYVQVGLFGKAISWDLDQVWYKELVVTGSNAGTPESWLRAIRLLADGTVSLERLITNAFSLDGWSDAFESFRGKAGIKTVFRPHL